MHVFRHRHDGSCRDDLDLGPSLGAEPRKSGAIGARNESTAEIGRVLSIVHRSLRRLPIAQPSIQCHCRLPLPDYLGCCYCFRRRYCSSLNTVANWSFDGSHPGFAPRSAGWLSCFPGAANAHLSNIHYEHW